MTTPTSRMRAGKGPRRARCVAAPGEDQRGTSPTIYKLLEQTVARTGLTTADGRPLRYRPHDFSCVVSSTDSFSAVTVCRSPRSGVLLSPCPSRGEHKNVRTSGVRLRVGGARPLAFCRAGCVDRTRVVHKLARTGPAPHRVRSFQQTPQKGGGSQGDFAAASSSQSNATKMNSPIEVSRGSADR